MTNYEKITKNYQKQLVESLKELVAINSVYDPDTIDEENPYGKGVSKALNYLKDLAKKDGFIVNLYDNRVLEILYGDGNKNLTILAHADIVPPGDNWEHDPFKVVEKKGVLFGRGVSDDKGPLLATYYALKALVDNELLLKSNCQIKFVIGGNEESGSGCLYHYYHTLKKPYPTLGFTPDCSFPCVFAEKGIVNFTITKKIKIPSFISLNGGVASNSVIDKAVLKMDVDNDFLNFIMDNYSKKEAEIITKNDVTSVIFHGLSCHASTPQNGINAGLIALKALARYTKNEDLNKLYKLLKPFDASGYNADGISKEMGHNTSNLGIIKTLDDGSLFFEVNYRFVDTTDFTVTKEKIKEAFKGFKIKFSKVLPLIYFPKQSNFVQTVLNVYQDETGDTKSKPLAIGGGTYAKSSKNVMGVGMEFPNKETFMHTSKEQINKDDLFKGMAIYAHLIVALCENIDNEN